MLNQQRIALPAQHRDDNYRALCLPQGRHAIENTYITAQELACLRLLFQGASHKQAAKCLNFSYRTVDTYLMRIKQRTGFSSWTDLERILFS